MQSTGVEISTSVVSRCHKRVSYNEDASTVKLWNIHTQQTKTGCEGAKEHSVCALYADEESESLNVQERKDT